jgi:DNA-binding CsgD family transcriptional regulator
MTAISLRQSSYPDPDATPTPTQPESLPILLERNGALAEMDGMAQQATRGVGQLLLLHGEAGVGKTAAIRRFASSIAGRFHVLLGCCDPLTAPRPLGPLIDMLTQLPTANAARLRASIAARDSESIYAELLNMFDDGSQWVCVIEDAHWADGATLDLLRFIARRVESLRLLVVVSYRDDELGPRHPLAVVLGDLSNHAALHRISLPPLSVEAVRVLAAGSGVNAEQLHFLTSGNPFYVTEILAAGADCTSGDALPRSVAEAVRGRLARLSECGRQAAEAVAVCGPGADPHLLDRLRPGASEGLGECMRAGILIGIGDSVQFRHELARRATLDQIPDYDRRVLHDRAREACQHRADTRAHPQGLTRREREILELLAIGHSDAEIAGSLFISQRTVNNHVHAILGKLGVHNRTQAASFASRALTDTQPFPISYPAVGSNTGPVRRPGTASPGR